ncbi:hypothetical protein ONS95_014963 [Cadophora gregata]|uniref:uncharacterized protein n=1 Tax=Cadophora gregata TaxID=51156 RepID=UPI0026DA7EDE|nr:uncharacterized protein ONS95_014963 [Cadophora gregata]KAK0103165.1 hypothetical protein ONS96_005772 [Cadophora gregata f. sp. sojae]KAK0113268.1 hypothetical protein ONS95_014963 [Cadophora gregata]
MIGMKSITALAAVVGVVYAVAVPSPEDEWHLSLLKRQEPGTPQYACHESCGTAITLSRGASPCTNDAFLTDYQECLECAGPDNFNIWRYYGGTLTTAGTNCGLSTTPVSGSSSSAASPSTAPAISTTPEPVTESTTTPEPETTAEPTTTPTSTGESSAISASATGYPTASTHSSTVSTTDAPTYTPHPTSSHTASAGNSTSTTVPFTGGANSANGKMVGAIAVVAGVVFAAAL